MSLARSRLHQPVNIRAEGRDAEADGLIGATTRLSMAAAFIGGLLCWQGERFGNTLPRWIAQRLRQRLGMASSSGNAAANCLLRFELQEFSQVFDAPTQSRGVLQGTASLIDARKQRIAGKDFLIEKPAASQDARGGVDALVAAGSELASQLGAWLGALEKGKGMELCQPTGPAMSKK